MTEYAILDIWTTKTEPEKKMRTVNLNFDQEDIEALAMILYPLGCEANTVEVVIGYLSTWGLNYSFVDIYLNVKDAEFTACYKKELKGEAAYVIGAVFNKQSKKYGFHS